MVTMAPSASVPLIITQTPHPKGRDYGEESQSWLFLSLLGYLDSKLEVRV